jgi:signal transduction histidine kinase/DNA-binding response OmpR family regulator/HPt (histidine-containing phosphotransfer) domain-containing protein
MTSPQDTLPEGFIEAVESAPFGFCLIGSNREILYMNYAFAPMTGKHAMGSPSQNLNDYLPESAIDLIFNQTQRSFDYDMEVETDSKTAQWIRIHVEKLKSQGRDYFCFWINDISQVIESEKRTRDAMKSLEAVAEMKSNLLATMSHEIRTPMQSVFGFLELIAEEKPEQKILDMVGTARSSAADLLEILDDVLDLAKLDADKMELDDFEIPLRTLAYGTLEAMEVKKYGADVELLHNIDKDVPFVVKGDPKRLRQILVNLIGNSLKFTRDGNVTLKISKDVQHITPPENGLGLRFEVADTGIGMTQEACDRLFQPFMQADNSTTREFGGTGLGLSICKKLMGLMKGEIGVYSQKGMGTTFWFEFPTYEVSTDQSTVTLPSLDGMVILVVEDHPKAIIEISNSLKSMGAEVEACSTYAEGLDLVKRRPFDAAVIDQGLPDGYGLNLIRDINDIRPYCGLVMYTVHDDYSIQNALRSLGAIHLLKPASRAGLGEAVKGVIKQISSQKIEGSQKLLIAEDTEAVREILQKQLDKLGIAVDFAENGKIALDMLETGEYGILISDLHMPEIDGYGVIKTIREKEEGSDTRFPVIVLTADVQMAQRQTYMDLGFDECLLKPVSLAQIRRLMMRWGLLPDQVLINTRAEEENRRADDAATPDQAITNLNAIDIGELENMLGDLDDMAIEMMGMFVEMTEPLIAELKNAHDQADWKAYEEVGHSLKGSARSACAMALGDICAAIQDDAASASDERRKEMLDAALAEFERVKAHIKHIQDNGF